MTLRFNFIRYVCLSFIFVFSAVQAQTDYAMIINAPANPDVYYPSFDRNVLKYYRTLGLSGIYRDKISIMSADGQNPFANTKVKDYSKLVSGVAASHRKIDGSAHKTDLRKKFQEIAKKMKSGDHFTLMITGHGRRKDGKQYIELWGEDRLSVEDLSSLIKILPAEATKHVVINTCFSGGFISLTDLPNTCVLTSVDGVTLMKARDIDDPYSDLLMDRLTAGTTFYDSQKNADLVDKRNGKGTNSLDWFLKNNEPKNRYVCESTADADIKELLKISMSALAHKENPVKIYMQAFNTYKVLIKKTLAEYDSMNVSARRARKNEFVVLLETMKQNINLMSNADKVTYLRDLSREQEFIEKGDPSKFKKFLQIKACVNYSLKNK